MFADTAKLIVDLSLAGSFAKQLGTSKKALSGFGKEVDKTGSRAYKAGTQIGSGIKAGLAVAAVGVGLIFSQVALGLNSLVTLEKATKQTEAVIKSTGKAAGISAEQVRNLAEKYEGLNATIDDKVIQSGENVLLTFTKIGQKAFEPALLSALNLSTVMKQDLQTSVVQVGKALNDPIRGLTALTKAGVTFDAKQKAQIVSLVGTGDAMKDLKNAQVPLTKDQAKYIKGLGKGVSALDASRKAGVKLTDKQRVFLKQIDDGSGFLKAQQIILGELDREFGGSFIAEGGTTGGKVAKFTDSIEDLQQTLAKALLPTVSIVADRLTEFLKDPAVQKGAADLGLAIAGLFNKENIETGVGILQGLFKKAQEAAPVIAEAAGVIGGVVSTAVSLFQQLPPELQALAVAGLTINKLTGGLVTNIAGGLISAVIASFKGLVNINAAAVTVNGPVAGAGVGGGATGGTSLLGSLSLLIAPLAVALAGIEVNKGVTDQATGLKDKTIQFAGSATDAELANSIKGVRENLESQGLNPFNQKGETVNVLNILIAEQNRRATELKRVVTTGADATTRAIKDKDLDVTVNTTVKNGFYVNGRLFGAAIDRTTSSVQNGSGVLHNGAN